MNNKNLKWLFILFGALLVAAMVAPYFLSTGPFDLERGLKGPDSGHIFGFDEDGRDLFMLVLVGARVSLGIGLLVTSITLTVGTLIGAVAGYFGGGLDELFVFVTDVFLAFPSILLVIALAAFQTETSIFQVVAILCVVGWVSFARLVRGQVLALKERDYLRSAEVVGCSFPRIFFRHLIPNMSGPLLVQAIFGTAGVIIAESTLSFLGLGVPPAVPSWGRLLDQGVQYLLVAPHLSIFPGIALMASIMGLNVVGDRLRDRLDVK